LGARYSTIATSQYGKLYYVKDKNEYYWKSENSRRQYAAIVTQKIKDLSEIPVGSQILINAYDGELCSLGRKMMSDDNKNGYVEFIKTFDPLMEERFKKYEIKSVDVYDINCHSNNFTLYVSRLPYVDLTYQL
jgi:hypothetical protein